MCLPYLAQHPKIVKGEKQSSYGDTSSSYNSGDLGCYAPDAVLGRVDVDQCRDQAGDRVQRNRTGTNTVSMYTKWVRMCLSQKDSINQPDVILSPTAPQQDASYNANDAEASREPQ